MKVALPGDGHKHMRMLPTSATQVLRSAFTEERVADSTEAVVSDFFRCYSTVA